MRSLCLALALLGASSAISAPAVERSGSAVADALLASLEGPEGFARVRADAVERNGRAVVVHRLSATTDAGETLNVERIVVDNGLVDAQNALTAERVVYEGVAVGGADEDARRTTVSGLALSAARFAPGGNGTGWTALVGGFDALAVTGLAATAQDGTPVTLAEMSLALQAGAGGAGAGADNTLAGRLAVEDFAFAVSLWEEPLASQLSALGYERVSIDLEAAGAWRTDTGELTVTAARAAAQGMGSLALTARVDGLTPAALARIGAGSEDVGALLDLLRTVSVAGLTVRYEDAGLAERLLRDAAKRAGVPPQALAEGLIGRLAQTLAPVGGAEFAARASAAARTFLSAPGAIAITMAPQTPVSVAALVGAALLGPQELPALLNVEIDATTADRPR